jgi:hypothetical protein
MCVCVESAHFLRYASAAKWALSSLRGVQCPRATGHVPTNHEIRVQAGASHTVMHTHFAGTPRRVRVCVCVREALRQSEPGACTCGTHAYVYAHEPSASTPATRDYVASVLTCRTRPVYQ